MLNERHSEAEGDLQYGAIYISEKHRLTNQHGVTYNPQASLQTCVKQITMGDVGPGRHMSTKAILAMGAVNYNNPLNFWFRGPRKNLDKTYTTK